MRRLHEMSLAGWVLGSGGQRVVARMDGCSSTIVQASASDVCGVKRVALTRNGTSGSTTISGHVHGYTTASTLQKDTHNYIIAPSR
jgi:hypothetical protein